jgi:hypothetical protein
MGMVSRAGDNSLLPRNVCEMITAVLISAPLGCKFGKKVVYIVIIRISDGHFCERLGLAENFGTDLKLMLRKCRLSGCDCV